MSLWVKKRYFFKRKMRVITTRQATKETKPLAALTPATIANLVVSNAEHLVPFSGSSEVLSSIFWVDHTSDNVQIVVFGCTPYRRVRVSSDAASRLGLSTSTN